MPVSYHIDESLSTIHTRCFGNVTFDEVIDHFQVLQRDPDCPGKLDVLLDLTECTSVPESGQLRTVDAAVGKIQDRVRFGACAVVVRDDLMFGMARMFLAFAENRFEITQVFRDLAEGKKWLESTSLH